MTGICVPEECSAEDLNEFFNLKQTINDMSDSMEDMGMKQMKMQQMQEENKRYKNQITMMEESCVILRNYLRSYCY